MEERILEFVRSLRNRGVPVSTAESMDALSAVREAGLEDPEVFRASLKAALVKTRKDGALFDELFPLYFYGLEGTGEVAAPREDILARLEEELRAFAAQNGHNPLLTLLLEGRGGEFESFIRAAAGAVGTSQLTTRMQVGMYTRRIFDSFDWERMDEDFRELQSRLRESGWTDEELEELERIYQANREALRRQVRRYVERLQARNVDRVPTAERMERLMHRPLSTLDEQELQQMRRAVDVLARKLRNKLSLREKRMRRDKLDVKATLRKNMRHGGVPFQLVLRTRRLEKVELMVLCDVSSSVARVSQFMLQFVYTLQDCLARVRSFVFVDELGEVTSFFHEEEIERGVKRALTEAGIAYHARSDFGYVFRQFCERYLQDVGFRTYILIIGDARNNYNDPCIWALERMRDRSKGIIWLNPETKPFWDTGDSVIGEYAPYCREVRVCRTLRDLEDTVSSLLL
ncbi:MAG: vWA domain-containing protein [Actinomycetota bacterium]